MPFITMAKETAPKKESVYHPEIRWKLNPEDHKDKYAYTGHADASTFIIEQAPRNRTINYRHHFYFGDQYTNYHLQMPWTYWVARVSKSGVILLSAMFFANKQLNALDEKGLCCAPLPNNDYGVDKGLGVCLWKKQASFGKDPEDAAIKCHEYIWTSDFNPGVSFYSAGRPKEIAARSWPSSLEKWEALTLEGKTIEWVPVKSEKLKRDCETLDDAVQWLMMERDHLYS